MTGEVLAQLPELQEVGVGLLHLLIRHTSASLTLNENASPEVRRDFEAWFSDAVPERSALWTHTLEGSDDMPAHIKASLLGPSLTLPISGGGARAGDLAGHLPVRAPQPRRRPLAGRDGMGAGRVSASPSDLDHATRMEPDGGAGEGRFVAHLSEDWEILGA